jgi:ATP-dependent helicase/nuclease subunit A
MPFALYKSSAGSGKTYTLVREYLRLVLDKPEKYNNILAITFTNKAAAEMKERIIRKLKELSEGKDTELLDGIKKELKISGDRLERNVPVVLGRILHNYSDFAIMTIDSFIHKIVRSFAVELDLPLAFDVDLNTDALRDKMVDNLVDLVGRDDFVTKVLIEFAMSRINMGETWDIGGNIKEVARELFSERGQGHIAGLKDVDFEKLIKSVREEFFALCKKAQALAKGVLLGEKELAKINYGAARHPIRSLLRLQEENSPMEIIGLLISVNSGSPELKRNLRDDPDAQAFLDRVNSAVGLIRELSVKCITLHQVHQNVHALAMLDKLSDLVGEYKRENNIVPISDFNRKVADIIDRDVVPFIYWRIGEKYEHYLMDEFQDTSTLQWENLIPLLENALAGGNFSLAVGDSKQAIYRWRGGDIGILETGVTGEFGEQVTQKRLGDNFRSLPKVVEFNNSFFSAACGKLGENVEELACGLYSAEGVTQVARAKEGGFVRIESFSVDKDDDRKFSEVVLDRLAETVQGILGEEGGFERRDIAILVRSNREGNRAAERLFYDGINVVSPDSLLLNSHPAVRFLAAALRYLAFRERTDLIAMVQFAAWLKDRGTKKNTHFAKAVADIEEARLAKRDDKVLEKMLPEDFVSRQFQLRKRPLHEAVEEISQIFGLTRVPGFVGYVQGFLESVQEFSRKFRGDMAAFLEWWEESTAKDTGGPALVVPEGNDAVTVMTIHKAKGLEFPVVIVPFATWDLGLTGQAAKSPQWMTPSEPLREAGGYDGAYLVQPKRDKCERSLFNEAYLAETSRTHTDNLNLVYVAFTRAIERLYVFVKKPKKDDSSDGAAPSNVSKLVLEVMKDLSAEPGWRTDGDSWEYGVAGKRTTEPKASAKGQPVGKCVSEPWRNRLVIRRQAGKLWKLDDPDRAQKVDRGNLVHALLSMIRTEKDIDRAVAGLVTDGGIADKDAAAMKAELRRIMDIEGGGVRVRDWFAEGLDVKTEPRAILEDDVLRPDRVILGDGRATVIDYKTGREDAKHAEQLEKYAAFLKNMGYGKVDKFVIYVETGRIVRV